MGARSFLSFSGPATGTSRYSENCRPYRDIFTFEGFSREGDIRLGNGKLLPKDWGHMSLGYVDTSYASQGKTVDRVFIATGTESLGATNQQQWYVSASRGREGARIYVDSKEEVREAIARTGQRLSAIELTRAPLRDSWRREMGRSVERSRVARFLRRRAEALAITGKGGKDRGICAVADSKEFLNRILDSKRPEAEDVQRSFSSERQHAAQFFNLHVAQKDGMRTEGFAWSHYSGYRWTDEGSHERLVVLFGTRAVEIEGQNLDVLVSEIREGQLNGVRELASGQSALLKQSNPDNQPIITAVKSYPDFDEILKTIKGEDDHEKRFTRRIER